VKRAINYIREHGQVNLAEVAHQFGFSDQAHMTREFRTIAHITPGQV
jgi:AraC-like DNA-binding protein